MSDEPVVLLLPPQWKRKINNNKKKKTGKDPLVIWNKCPLASSSGNIEYQLIDGAPSDGTPYYSIHPVYHQCAQLQMKTASTLVRSRGKKNSRPYFSFLHSYKMTGRRAVFPAMQEGNDETPLLGPGWETQLFTALFRPGLKCRKCTYKVCRHARVDYDATCVRVIRARTLLRL